MKKKEKPDENFYKILNDLRGVAVNINQLAKVANTYQYVDDNKYYPLANRVNDMIDDLQKFYLTPTKKRIGEFMAVTKFLSRKTRLDMIIKYIMNGEKTEKNKVFGSENSYSLIPPPNIQVFGGFFLF